METENMLVQMGYAIRKRVTGREEFLRTMHYVIPWAEWVDYVRPFVPADAQDDRRVNLLLRMYLLQKWFGLQDAQVEDTIHDSYAMWLFMGMNTLEEGLPKQEVYTAFRKALEQSDACMMLSVAIENFLRRYGRKMVAGSVTEATIVQDTGDGPIVSAAPAQEKAAEPPRAAGAAGDPHTAPAHGARHAPSAQEAEVIRQLEERLRRLEASEPARFDVQEPPRKEEDDPDIYEEDTEQSGWRTFGRLVLILLLLAMLAGVAIVGYDYLQTGVWFRWFPAISAPLADRAGAATAPTATPTPQAEPALIQKVIPTPAATVAAAGAGLLPGPTAAAAILPTYESLLEAVNQPNALAGTGREIHAGILDGVPYDADAQIQQSLLQLEAGATPATVLLTDDTRGKKISLTIDGMYEAETMRKILDLLAAHDVAVTFFPTGLQTADTPEIVREIAQAGYPIGNYTLRGEAGMEAQDARVLVENFAMAGKIIEVVTGSTPTRLKANATDYTEHVLLAAGACGLTHAVQSTAYVTYHSFKRYDEALAYVNRMPYGSIVSVKLSGILDPSEYQPLEIIEQPAIDKEESAVAAESPVSELSESERLLLVIQWLLEAVDNAAFSTESVVLREANGGALAEVAQTLHTTQPAVAYTFYGDYGREAELQAVLASLEAIGGKGTFFVSVEDLAAHQQALLALVSAGHSLGVMATNAASQDYYAACHQLIRAREAMATLLGYEARLVMVGGTATEALREAIASLDMLLVGSDLTLTRDETQAAKTAQEIIDILYGESTDGFQRGKILRYRLGFMASETVLGELIAALEGTRNAYAVTGVYEIATNTEALYTYPLPDEAILPEVLDRIHPGQLTATGDDFFAFALERYIGNPDIIDAKRLPGFSRQEIYALDRKGKIPDVQGIAFLTFDDWGTDVHVTRLLDVLREHNVRATFFVRTEFVEHNPNLLRAIAVEGHEIASHTHTHLALANAVGDTWAFEELTQEQLAALRADIQTSWGVLQRIVGDIRLDTGAPALSTVFRPPTLAVSRNGMEAVLDMGMTYIVNGEYTTQDYQAKSVKALLSDLRENIRNGTIVVMHFSDTAVYTADAVDQYLTLNAAGDNRRTYAFGRLSDYLQPTTGDDTAE